MITYRNARSFSRATSSPAAPNPASAPGASSPVTASASRVYNPAAAYNPTDTSPDKTNIAASDARTVCVGHRCAIAYTAPSGPPMLIAVTARQVINPKNTPDPGKVATGSGASRKFSSPKTTITAPITTRSAPGSAAFSANTPTGAAASPPAISPRLRRKSICRQVRNNTSDSRMVVSELTATIVVLAPRNSNNGGDETTPNPKLTVPSTTPPAATATSDSPHSGSDNSEPQSISRPDRRAARP